MTLRRRWRFEGENVAPTQRLETLADGVFAIVMTLLILELSVPVVAEATDTAIGKALAAMWPEFLIYGLSFLVLGVFWLMHKMIFDALEASDPPLIWLNVVFLMIIALLPFSTALVGEYRAVTVVAIVYGSNLTLGFGGCWAMLAYATRGKRLIRADTEPVVIRGANRMGMVYLLVLTGGTVLALVSPVLSYAVHGAFAAMVIIMTMVGRWESVMVWAVAGDHPDDR